MKVIFQLLIILILIASFSAYMVEGKEEYKQDLAVIIVVALISGALIIIL